MNVVLSVFAAVLNSLWLAAIVAALIWLVLRAFNAATRFVIWWVALAVVLMLPAAPAMRVWWRARPVTEPAAHVNPLTAPVNLAFPIDDPPAIVTLKQDRSSKWPLGIVALWAALCLYRLGQIGRSYFYLRGVKQRASVSVRLLPGVSRSALLLMSREIASPMAAGFLRPAVILPESLREEITPQELDHVLLHETAHLERLDDWTNLIARLLGAILALHPVVVWILWQIDRERETACDDWVVAKTGAARPYAASLARMFELRAARRRDVVGEALASGIFGGGSQAGARIETLLKRGREFSPRASLGRVAASAVAQLALVVAGTFTPPWIAFAQARSAFEVASVRSVRLREHAEPSFEISPGTLRVQRHSLKSLIAWAYRIDHGEINGPRWLDTENFDITAKADGPASADQLRLMLQTLIEERFRLAYHRDQKLMPLYSLVVEKNGPKMREVQGEPRQGGKIGWRDNQFQYEMVTHVSQLAQMLPDFLDGRPVQDDTGLTGVYEIDLSVEMDAAQIKQTIQPGMVFNGFGYAPGVFDAVAKLGLKLVATRGPVDVLTIDHVEKPDASQ